MNELRFFSGSFRQILAACIVPTVIIVFLLFRGGCSGGIVFLLVMEAFFILALGAFGFAGKECLWLCSGFSAARIRYGDTVSVGMIPESGAPENPLFLQFYFRDGTFRRIGLGHFPPGTGKWILSLVQDRIRSDEPLRFDPESPERWLKIKRKKTCLVHLFLSFAMFAGGFAVLGNPVRWFFFLAGTLFLLVLLRFYLRERKLRIPDELKEYMDTTGMERQIRTAFSIRGRYGISIGHIGGPLCKTDEGFVFFPATLSVSLVTSLFLFLILSVAGGFLIAPHFFIGSLMIAVLLFLEMFPRRAVFDRTKGMILFTRRRKIPGAGEAFRSGAGVSISELTGFSLSIRPAGSLILSGIGGHGIEIPLASAEGGKKELLLGDAVKIARLMGNLPITTI